SPAEIRAALESRPSIKGEMTLLIGKASAAAPETTTIDEAVALHIHAGMSRMDAIKEVARTRGLSKRDVYRQTQIEKR
ncbi:MAG TPA: hypothetical protein VNH19_08905, partial [Candidatus Limnocylindrales bacterium]|nr:hypothetical protein [Candidatus Limnocylindrales bacterium]